MAEGLIFGKIINDYFFSYRLANKSNFSQLTKNLANKGGRAHGKIASPRRGALCRRSFRFIDRQRSYHPESIGVLLKRFKIKELTVLVA